MDINQSLHVKIVVDPDKFLKGYISIENKYKILVSKSYVK